MSHTASYDHRGVSRKKGSELKPRTRNWLLNMVCVSQDIASLSRARENPYAEDLQEGATLIRKHAMVIEIWSSRGPQHRNRTGQEIARLRRVLVPYTAMVETAIGIYVTLYGRNN